jgi:orotate phosphoribosyltransferase
MKMQFKPTSREELLIELYKIGVIKFGEFILKSGKKSPIYVDMRKVVSYPEILEALTYVMWEKIQEKPFDLLCGVPYGAVPLATALSLYSHKPMIMQRKEAKEHGTKQTVEGVYQRGDQVLLVEDVTTTGGSILQSALALEALGLRVQNAVVFLDRDQGACEALFAQGIVLDPVCTLESAVEILYKEQHVSETNYIATKQYLQQQ